MALASAVLVVSKGRVVHAKGYGQADLSTNRPITTDTLFELASVSKQFTSMAIMMLAEESRLRYSDDIRTYLPEFPQHKPGRAIAVSDLLHHISGIPDYMDVWEGDEAAFARLTNADILKLLAKQPLSFPTGTKYDYSNSNYVLLALIVKRIARQTFSQFMTERIFAPLGMKHSRFTTAAAGRWRTWRTAMRRTRQADSRPIAGRTSSMATAACSARLTTWRCGTRRVTTTGW